MKAYLFLGLGLSFVLSACGNNDIPYDASGVFETTEVIVSAQATGELLSFTVEEGMNVKADEKLGYVDTLQLALKKKQLTATLAATDSKWLDEKRQSASLRQQIINLERERKRFGDLLEADAATEKQVDELDYQIDVLKRQLSATEEQLNSHNKSLDGQCLSLEAQLAQLEDQIEKSVVCDYIGIFQSLR